MKLLIFQPPPLPPPSAAAPPLPMNQMERSAPAPRAPDPRDALLESIRKGKSLKKVDMDEKPIISPPNDKPNADNLAKSLNAFLASRKDKIRDSSDSEEEHSDEWENE